MGRKSIKKNYIYNLSYQILALVVPLITTPYISRILGADGIGTVSFSESIVSYFTLFAIMGVSTHGQREISYVQNSKKERSIVFWNTKLLQTAISTIVLILYVSFALWHENSSLYLVLSFHILAVLIDVTWFFQGMEEFGRIVLRNIIFKIINVLYIFLVVKSKEDLLLYALGIALFPVLSNLSLWPYLKGQITIVNKSQLHPLRAFKTVLSLFIPTVAIQIYTVLDKIMIGLITQSAFENGYYEQAIRISKMVMVLITSLGTVMIPRIGYYFQSSDQKEIQRLMYRGYRFVWMMGIPLCFGLIAVSSNFVPWFYGAGYEKVADLLRILSFLILAIGINNVTGMQYLIPTKRQNTFTVTVIVGACVNFILNAILICHFASVGAAIASVVAESVIAVVQIYIVRKELKPVEIIKSSIHYVIAGLVMFFAVAFVGEKLEPTIINSLLLCIMGAVMYCSILLLIKDEFVLSNISAVLHKFKEKG